MRAKKRIFKFSTIRREVALFICAGYFALAFTFIGVKAGPWILSLNLSSRLPAKLSALLSKKPTENPVLQMAAAVTVSEPKKLESERTATDLSITEDARTEISPTLSTSESVSETQTGNRKLRTSLKRKVLRSAPEVKSNQDETPAEQSISVEDLLDPTLGAEPGITNLVQVSDVLALSAFNGPDPDDSILKDDIRTSEVNIPWLTLSAEEASYIHPAPAAVREIFGVIKRDRYHGLRESLRVYQEESHLGAQLKPASSESALATWKIVETVASSKSEIPKPPSPDSKELESSNRGKDPSAFGGNVLGSAIESIPNASRSTVPVFEDLKASKPSLVSQSPASAKSVAAEVAAKEASLSSGISTSASGSAVAIPSMGAKQDLNSHSMSSQNPAIQVPPKPEVKTIRGTLQGKLTLDRSAQDWIDSQKGHIGLSLRPASSRDPLDEIVLDFSYPMAEEFKYEALGIVGPAILSAQVFAKNHQTPVSVVQFPLAITDANYKEYIRFHVKGSQIKQAYQNRGPNPQLSAVVTIFEGASPDFQKPREVVGAKVRVLNRAELGTFSSDSTGTVTISNIPSHSELSLEVIAPGFYPAYSIVPVFQNIARTAVYLVSKEKTEDTRLLKDLLAGKKKSDLIRFLREPASSQYSMDKSVVMGRVFDPATGVPQKGEQVEVQYVQVANGSDSSATATGRVMRRRPIYFGELPDPSLNSTTDLGLFGALDLPSPFVFIKRDSDRVPYFLHVRPGTGEYVQLGRGGSQTLSLRFLEPVSQSGVPAAVKFLGDISPRGDTDNDGRIQIPNVDLPRGIVTLQVSAKGFPNTRHTIPFDPREKVGNRDLYLVDHSLLKEVLVSSNQPPIDWNRGNIFGGTHPSFFQDAKACIFVSLFTMDGVPVGKDKGPFPIVPAKSADKLCLTQQQPGFIFRDLDLGKDYFVNWTDSHGRLLRTRHVGVGAEDLSILVN